MSKRESIVCMNNEGKWVVVVFNLLDVAIGGDGDGGWVRCAFNGNKRFLLISGGDCLLKQRTTR